VATTRGNSPRRPQQVTLALVVEQLGSNAATASSREAEVGGVAQHPAGAGVGVLHVEDRVVVGAPWSTGRGRGRAGESAGSGPARSARRRRRSLDQVVEGDDGAGPLGHPQRLRRREQVDHLADQDLEVDAGVVAERRRHRLHPADVAVVVGAEHDQMQRSKPRSRLSR
jgi:hypothetical protein